MKRCESYPGKYVLPDFRFCLIFVYLYVFSLSRFCGVMEWMPCSANTPFYTYFTYIWLHKSWTHLILNVLAFFSISTLLSQKMKSVEYMVSGYIIAVVSAFITAGENFVCGSSGWVCALWGMDWASLILSGECKSYRFFTSTFGFLVTMLLGFFHPAFDGILHLVAFFFGCLYVLCRRFRSVVFGGIIVLFFFTSCSVRKKTETVDWTVKNSVRDTVSVQKQEHSEKCKSNYVTVETEEWEAMPFDTVAWNGCRENLQLKKKKVVRVTVQNRSKYDREISLDRKQESIKDSTRFINRVEKEQIPAIQSWKTELWLVLILFFLIGIILYRIKK